MMDNLRAMTNQIVLKIILALMILSFILTGVGGYLTGTGNDFAAKVNNEKITMAQWEQTVQREHALLQQQLGEQFSALASNDDYMPHLRQEVLKQLINNMLVEQYASELSFTVSDEKVKEFIRKIPFFQNEGQFDNDKYKELVQRMGYTLEQFAQLQRKQLINQQVLQPFTDTGFVLPIELQSLSELMLQQRNIRLITINIEALQAQQKINDEELKTYYEKNKNRFLAPEKLKVSYIPMDAASMLDKITVGDEEISTYYAQHKSHYIQPERRNYSIIQFKTEAQAQRALEMLKKGTDFATIAKEQSIDIISRKNGGKLGWLEPETTPNELKKANLTVQGELSGIIKSSVGYLIVRLNELKLEQVKPLTEVRAEIIEQIKREKSVDAYYTLQQKVTEATASDHQSLVSAEKAAGIHAKVTDWFTKDNIPDNLNFKPVLQVLFDGSLIDENGISNNSNVITVEGDRAFLLRINERKPEHIQPFDHVQPQVTELVRRQKALQQARREGEKLLQALQQETDDEVRKAAQLDFSEKKTISRSSEHEPWVETVFSLPHPQKDKPVYGLTQDSQDNIVLIELQSIITGQLSNNDRQPFITKMKESIDSITFYSLMDNLRKKATIKFNMVEQSSQ